MSAAWVAEYIFQMLTVSAIGYLFAIVKNISTKNKATQAGVTALLRDRLISAIHVAKSRGHIYIHELENIDKMYTEYINLGGNGALVHLMNELDDLPTRTTLKD